MTVRLNPNHEPADCYICRRHATGIGMGNASDPKWICTECALLIEDIRKVKRFDAYEDRAIDDAGQDAGGYLDAVGKTDLAELDELQWRSFLEKVVRGFGASLRKQIRSNGAPF